MSQRYNGKQKAILVFSVLCLVIGVPVLQAFKQPEFASITMFMGCLFSFFFAVDYEGERMVKGMGIIVFGIIFGSYYPEMMFYANDGKKLLSQEVLRNLDVFEKLIVFACAGAGGSIIANHADKSSSDREEAVVSQTVIDKTKGIDNLITHVTAMNKKINNLIYFIVVISIFILVYIAI